MSLILDALKKSEAERKLGQAPGLLSTQNSPERAAHDPRRGLRIALISISALLIVTLLILAFWMGRQQSTDGKSPQANAPATQHASVPSQAGSGETNPSSPQQKPPVTDRTSGAAPRKPASGIPRPTVSVSAAQPARRTPKERESMPVAAGSLPATSQAEAQPPQPQAISSTTKPAPEGESPIVETSKPELEQLPRVFDLSQAERAGLPPLQVSMYVYSEDRARRFVLIDGHRYGEGENIASGLSSEEIRSDGIVLDFQKRRFLLPRR